MKYFFLLLLSFSLIHCERDKSSLPGSYKLEKPTDQAIEQNSYYSIRSELNLKRDTMGIAVVAYSNKTNTALKTIKDGGSLALKSLTNEEKRYVQVNIKDKNKDRDLIFNLPLDVSSKEPKLLDFVYDAVVYSLVYSCHNENCESIKFSIRATRPDDTTKVAFKGIAFYWILTPIDNSFIFKTVCKMADPNNSNKLIDDPYYFLNLTRDSAELKCTDY